MRDGEEDEASIRVWLTASARNDRAMSGHQNRRRQRAGGGRWAATIDGIDQVALAMTNINQTR
jgi:hypothetical protein